MLGASSSTNGSPARVLLLSDEEARGMLWCAATGGHDVVVAGAPSRNATLRYSSKARRFYALPDHLRYEDAPEELVSEILRIVQTERIDVIVPTSFESLKFCVTFRERLEAHTKLVPLADMERIGILDDKYRFYRFCVDNGIPHPASSLIERPEDLSKAETEALTFPILTKPLLGAGDIGIERFDTREAFQERVRSAPASFFPALAQEWFAGQDIDFNGYALNGKVAVSSVMRTKVYDGRTPVRLTDFVRDDRVQELGRKIVERANFTGPLNVDLRVRDSDGEVLLIEVNPRFWNRSVTSLIDGLNFVDAAIRLTTDPEWRSESLCANAHWASTLGGLVRGALLHRDKDAWEHLGRLTSVQMRYLAHYAMLERYSKLRRALPFMSALPLL